MDYVALYRKWRPQDFTALIGQEHIKTAISNALLQNRIAHAYLFSGPRGTGKTSTAKILAKAVNCEQGPTPEPCNECNNCLRVNQGSSMDVFEIDAASNRGIDEIRELREKIRFSPVEGRKRVYIIDEVHMLTTEAFNALLKTLEEPPEHVLFILATTEPHKLPATILSRCQRYDFRRLGIEDTVARLEEVATNSGLEITPGALKLIAAQADGGMRDALSLLDQCSVLAEGEINEEVIRTLLGIVGKDALRELVEAIGRGEEKQVLQLFDQLLLAGKDIKQLLGELSSYLRAVLLFKTSPEFNDIYITDSRENLSSVAQMFSERRLIEAAKRLHLAAGQLRLAIQGRITAEICLLELCEYEQVDINALLLRIEKLEAAVGRTDRAAPAAGMAGQTKPVPVQAAPAQADKSIPAGEKTIKAETRAAQAEQPKFSLEEDVQAETVKQIEHEIIIQDEPELEPPKQEEAVQDFGKIVAQPVGDFTEVWEKVLQNIHAQKKLAVKAFAVNAKLLSLNDGIALLQFEKDFMCKKMQEKEYKDVVETALSAVTGQQYKVTCKTGEAAKPVKAQTGKKAAEVKQAAEEELPDAVRTALEVFGGEVYKIKK